MAIKQNMFFTDSGKLNSDIEVYDSLGDLIEHASSELLYGMNGEEFQARMNANPHLTDANRETIRTITNDSKSSITENLHAMSSLMSGGGRGWHTLYGIDKKDNSIVIQAVRPDVLQAMSDQHLSPEERKKIFIPEIRFKIGQDGTFTVNGHKMNNHSFLETRDSLYNNSNDRIGGHQSGLVLNSSMTTILDGIVAKLKSNAYNVGTRAADREDLPRACNAIDAMFRNSIQDVAHRLRTAKDDASTGQTAENPVANFLRAGMISSDILQQQLFQKLERSGANTSRLPSKNKQGNAAYTRAYNAKFKDFGTAYNEYLSEYYQYGPEQAERNLQNNLIKLFGKKIVDSSEFTRVRDELKSVAESGNLNTGLTNSYGWRGQQGQFNYGPGVFGPYLNKPSKIRKVRATADTLPKNTRQPNTKAPGVLGFNPMRNMLDIAAGDTDKTNPVHEVYGTARVTYANLQTGIKQAWEKDGGVRERVVAQISKQKSHSKKRPLSVNDIEAILAGNPVDGISDERAQEVRDIYEREHNRYLNVARKLTVSQEGLILSNDILPNLNHRESKDIGSVSVDDITAFQKTIKETADREIAESEKAFQDKHGLTDAQMSILKSGKSLKEIQDQFGEKAPNLKKIAGEYRRLQTKNAEKQQETEFLQFNVDDETLTKQRESLFRKYFGVTDNRYKLTDKSGVTKDANGKYHVVFNRDRHFQEGDKAVITSGTERSSAMTAAQDIITETAVAAGLPRAIAEQISVLQSADNDNEKNFISANTTQGALHKLLLGTFGLTQTNDFQAKLGPDGKPIYTVDKFKDDINQALKPIFGDKQLALAINDQGLIVENPESDAYKTIAANIDDDKQLALAINDQGLIVENPESDAYKTIAANIDDVLLAVAGVQAKYRADVLKEKNSSGGAISAEDIVRRLPDATVEKEVNGVKQTETLKGGVQFGPKPVLGSEVNAANVSSYNQADNRDSKIKISERELRGNDEFLGWAVGAGKLTREEANLMKTYNHQNWLDHIEYTPQEYARLEARNRAAISQMQSKEFDKEAALNTGGVVLDLADITDKDLDSFKNISVNGAISEKDANEGLLGKIQQAKKARFAELSDDQKRSLDIKTVNDVPLFFALNGVTAGIDVGGQKKGTNIIAAGDIFGFDASGNFKTNANNEVIVPEMLQGSGGLVSVLRSAKKAAAAGAEKGTVGTSEILDEQLAKYVQKSGARFKADGSIYEGSVGAYIDTGFSPSNLSTDEHFYEQYQDLTDRGLADSAAILNEQDVRTLMAQKEGESNGAYRKRLQNWYQQAYGDLSGGRKKIKRLTNGQLTDRLIHAWTYGDEAYNAMMEHGTVKGIPVNLLRDPILGLNSTQTSTAFIGGVGPGTIQTSPTGGHAFNADSDGDHMVIRFLGMSPNELAELKKNPEKYNEALRVAQKVAIVRSGFNKTAGADYRPSAPDINVFSAKERAKMENIVDDNGENLLQKYSKEGVGLFDNMNTAVTIAGAATGASYSGVQDTSDKYHMDLGHATLALGGLVRAGDQKAISAKKAVADSVLAGETDINAADKLLQDSYKGIEQLYQQLRDKEFWEYDRDENGQIIKGASQKFKDFIAQGIQIGVFDKNHIFDEQDFGTVKATGAWDQIKGADGNVDLDRLWELLQTLNLFYSDEGRGLTISTDRGETQVKGLYDVLTGGSNRTALVPGSGAPAGFSQKELPTMQSMGEAMEAQKLAAQDNNKVLRGIAQNVASIDSKIAGEVSGNGAGGSGGVGHKPMTDFDRFAGFRDVYKNMPAGARPQHISAYAGFAAPYGVNTDYTGFENALLDPNNTKPFAGYTEEEFKKLRAGYTRQIMGTMSHTWAQTIAEAQHLDIKDADDLSLSLPNKNNPEQTVSDRVLALLQKYNQDPNSVTDPATRKFLDEITRETPPEEIQWVDGVNRNPTYGDTTKKFDTVMQRMYGEVGEGRVKSMTDRARERGARQYDLVGSLFDLEKDDKGNVLPDAQHNFSVVGSEVGTAYNANGRIGVGYIDMLASGMRNGKKTLVVSDFKSQAEQLGPHNAAQILQYEHAINETKREIDANPQLTYQDWIKDPLSHASAVRDYLGKDITEEQFNAMRDAEEVLTAIAGVDEHGSSGLYMLGGSPMVHNALLEKMLRGESFNDDDLKRLSNLYTRLTDSAFYGKGSLDSDAQLLFDEALGPTKTDEKVNADLQAELAKRHAAMVDKVGIATQLQDTTLSADDRATLETELKKIDESILKVIEHKIEVYKKHLDETDQYSGQDTQVSSEEKARIQKAGELKGKQDQQKADQTRKDEAYKVYHNLEQANKSYNDMLAKADDAKTKYGTDSMQYRLYSAEAADLLDIKNQRTTEKEKFENEHANDARYTGANGYFATQQNLAYLKVNQPVEQKTAATSTASKATQTAAEDTGSLFSAIRKTLGPLGTMLTRCFSLYSIMYKLRASISSLVKQSQELDTTLTNLRIVTGDTKDGTRDLISSYADLATQLGSTTKEVATSATEWLRQGYEAAEVTDLVTASLYLSKLGMLDSATATKSLTSMLKGFKLEASEAVDVVDKLTSLDLEAATSAGDIAQGLAQFANLSSLSGVDIDEAAAYVTTISDVTQMSGSSVGNALKTIISRYGNVKAGKYNQLNVNADSADEGESVNDVEQVLKKIGIQIRSSSLEFKDFSDVLTEIAEKWDTLDTVSQKAISTAFAGVRQQEAFVTLMQNWDKYEDLLEVSQNSEGTAERKYAAYTDSYTAATNNLTAAIEKVTNDSQIINLLTEYVKIKETLVQFLPWIVKFGPQLLLSLDSLKSLFGQSFLQKTVDSLARSGRFSGFDQGVASGMFTLLHGSKNNKSTYAMERYNNSAVGTAIGKLFGGRKKGKSASTTTTVQAAAAAGATSNAATTSENEALTANNTALTENTTKLQQITPVLTDATTKLKEFANATSSATRHKKKHTKAVREDTNETNKDKNAKQGEAQAAQQSANADQQEAQASQQATSADQQEAQASQQVATTGTTGSSGSMLGMALGSLILNQGLSALSTYQTIGLQHENSEGETVSSSEAAREQAKTMTWAAALIPVVGSYLADEWGTEIAAEVDAERDLADLTSEKANSVLTLLSSIDGNVTTMRELAQLGDASTEAERQAEADEILEAMYGDASEETTAARVALEQHISDLIGEDMTLREALYEYVHSDDLTRRTELAQVVAIAEKQIELDQLDDSNASDNVTYIDNLNEALTELNKLNTRENDARTGLSNEDQTNAEVAGVSAGATTASIGATLTALATILVAGIGTAASGGAASPIAVPAIITAIAGLTGTGIASYAVGSGTYDSVVSEKQEEQKQTLSEILDSEDSTDTKIQALQDKVTEYEGYVDDATAEGDTEDAEYYSSLISGLNEYINELESHQGYQKQQADEKEEAFLESVMLQAQDRGYYLTNMNIPQLKQLGNRGIYETAARYAVEAGGDADVIYDSNGEVSDTFIDRMGSLLKEDEEIEAALSGEDYTLNEAMQLNPDDKFDAQILQNFADALGTTIDGLVDYTNELGTLKLSELYLSATDLSEEIDNYSSLLTDITDSTKSAATWMKEIVNKYPDLIQYMSDTPTLISKVIEKIKALNDEYTNTMYLQLSESEDYFKDVIQPEILSYIGQTYGSDARANAQQQITDWGASDTATLTNYIVDAYYNTKAGTDERTVSDQLLDALQHAGTNTKIVSDQYEELLEDYVEYNVQFLEKQLTNLEEQKSALEQINEQREYELELIKAKINLEESAEEKRRVYRTGVGWVYEADQSKMAEAQDELEEVENEKDVSRISKQIEELTGLKDEWSNMWEKKNFENLTTTAKEFEKQFLKIDSSYTTMETAFGTNGATAHADAADISGQTFAVNTSVGNVNTTLGDIKSEISNQYLAACDYNDKLKNAIEDMLAEPRNDYDIDTDDDTYYSDDDTYNYIYTDSSDSTTTTEEEEEESGSLFGKIVGGAIGAASGFALGGGNLFTGVAGANAGSTFLSSLFSGEGLGASFSNAWSALTSGASSQWKTITSAVETDTERQVQQAEDAIKNGTLILAPSAHAAGTLSSDAEVATINELGTEAIITPNGTITALPSHSGIVPADITKNLWELGEVAPSILRAIGDYDRMRNDLSTTNNNSAVDESFNINTLTMNVSADNSFDADAFVSSIRSRVALTKNTR